MFVYTNISLFKTVQKLNNLMNLEEFWSLSSNRLSQGNAFLTIFLTHFWKQNQDFSDFFQLCMQYDVIIKHKKYLGVISLITEK